MPVILECLERRRLFNVTLEYNGSGGDDAYLVRLKGGDPSTVEIVETLDDGAAVTHAAAAGAVTLVDIATGAGFDVLTVDQSNGPVPPVTFAGGSSFDEMVYVGSAGTDVVTVNPNSLDGPGVSVGYGSVEGIALNGHAGDDAFVIGTGNLDAITAAVTVIGGGGTDTVRADDDQNSFEDAYTLTATRLDRDVFGSLNYEQIEGLTLDAQGGGNVFIVNSTAAGTPATINGGGGSDVLILNAYASHVAFNGGLNPAEADSLIINSGTYTLATDAGAGTANLDLQVNSGAHVVFNASQRLASLNLYGGGGATVAPNGSRVIDVGTLDLDGGTLDLKDNDLVARGMLTETVTAYVNAGRGSGAWDGGSGIVTTVPAAAAGAGAATHLGVATASQALAIAAGATGTWGGRAVSGSAVLVKYTHSGDADLNGIVDGDDYFLLDAHVGVPPAVARPIWFHGDFNYDGKINGDDYFLIDSVIDSQGGVI
ncbi:MAG TPA: hypothetical protein VER17_13970 [Tepidisphaeraceae bacterium]|nr:hypothetical protein [Tepidisphaeraceae bacterium]